MKLAKIFYWIVMGLFVVALVYAVLYAAELIEGLKF